MPEGYPHSLLEAAPPTENEMIETLQFGKIIRLVECHPSAVALLAGRRLIFANRGWRRLFKGEFAEGLGRGGHLETPAIKKDPALRLQIDSGGRPMPPDHWEALVKLPSGFQLMKFFCITLGKIEGHYFSAVAAFHLNEDVDSHKWAFPDPRPVDLDLLGIPVTIFSIADGSLLAINEESLRVMGVQSPEQLTGPGPKRIHITDELEREKLALQLFIEGRVAETSTVVHPVKGPAVVTTATLTAFNYNGIAACLAVVNRIAPYSTPDNPASTVKLPTSTTTAYRDDLRNDQIYIQDQALSAHPRLLQIHFSLAGQVTYMNEFAREMLACYRTVPANSDDRAYKNYDLPGDMAATFSRLAADSKALPCCESEIIGPDDRKVSIAWTVLGFFNNPDLPVEIAVVGYDGTKAKLAEKERETALIRAREAGAAKDAVLSNFNQAALEPMNVLLSYLELIADPGLLEDHQVYLRLVQQAIMTMNNLTSGLWDFSLTALEADAFQLDTLILEVLELVQAEVDSKKLVLSSWLQPGTPTRLIGDVTRLKQMLWHLLDNAARYTDVGRISLSVRALAEQELDGQVKLLFSITDTGLGMSPEQIKSFLKSPASAGPPPLRPGGGRLGLGLRLCQKFSALMGGGLRVESSPGLGSTVLVSAVFKCQDKPVFNAQNDYYDWFHKEKTGHYKEEAKAAGVLVVERRPKMVALLSNLFISAGVPVTVTRDGDDALVAMERAMVKEKPFQMIIIGSHFKGLFSPGNLARKMRESFLGAFPPLIIIGDLKRPWFLDRGRPDFPFYVPRNYLPAGFMKSVRALMLAHAFSDLAADQQPLNLLVSAEMRPDSQLENQIEAAMLKKGYQIFVTQGAHWSLKHPLDKPLNLLFLGLPLSVDYWGPDAPPQWAENLIPILAAVGPKVGEFPQLRQTDNSLTDFTARRLADLINWITNQPESPPSTLPDAENGPPEAGGLEEETAVFDAVMDNADLFRPPLPPNGVVAVLDEEDVLKRTGGDRELLAVLASMMEESLSETMEKIHRAAALDDRNELRFQAHFLRGAASNMSAQAVAAKAFSLEIMPGPYNHDDLSAALKALEDEVERLRPALKQLADRQPALAPPNPPAPERD